MRAGNQEEVGWGYVGRKLNRNGYARERFRRVQGCLRGFERDGRVTEFREEIVVIRCGGVTRFELKWVGGRQKRERGRR